MSIIPHTSQQTTLLTKGSGNTVNLECDVIAKYVEKLMDHDKSKENNVDEINTEMLIKYGFM